jgi:serine/threonine protein kinase
MKDGQEFLVLKVPHWAVEHHRRIIQVQNRLPFVPKLSYFQGPIFLMENCRGHLLWEMEDARQFSSLLPSALRSLVAALDRVGLVHADIRPWNIFFDPASREFRVIDWGFSFFSDCDLGAEPFWHLRSHLRARGHSLASPMQVDRLDAEKVLQVVSGGLCYEEAWRHEPGEIAWQPPWAGRR